MSRESYNLKSMRKYGWGPEDIGLPLSAPLGDVTVRVLILQREWHIKVDGYVGEVTSRYILTQRELRLGQLSEDQQNTFLTGGIEGQVMVDGRLIPVPFKAVPTGMPGSLDLSKYSGKRKKAPTQVLWHWDVCTSTAKCFRVLRARHLSSHGGIDNDGTFYQFLDFSTRYGWHGGKRAVNKASIGIDVSNAVYLKYQYIYEKLMDGAKRPEISARVNRYTHKKFLGYYEEQIETAKALAEFLNEYFGIEMATPMFGMGGTNDNIIRAPHKFKGHIAHYHVSKMKWDVAGFPFKYVIGVDDSYANTPAR